MPFPQRFPVIALPIAAVAIVLIAAGWSKLSLGGAADHRIAMPIAWHGRLMVFGWAICVPLGVLAARYFKLRPRQDWPRELDSRQWWHAHRVLAVTGIAAATIGVWLVWPLARGATPLARAHATIGWILLGTGWFQIVAGLARGSKGGPTDRTNPTSGGDHYRMTRRRILFEYAHKLGGYGALLLSFAAVPTGLALAQAPPWMWIVIGLWWIALAATAIRLQRAGRCVDTYQAIWGPDPDLPGNRLRPIGWGIQRPRGNPWGEHDR